MEMSYKKTVRDLRVWIYEHTFIPYNQQVIVLVNGQPFPSDNNKLTVFESGIVHKLIVLSKYQ